MSWIDEYSKASYSLYAGNSIDAFQPLDFFHFYGLWYDLWLQRIIGVMDKINADHKSYSELKSNIPTPSNLRALIQKAIPAYIGSDHTKKYLYQRYTNFIARMLMEACPEDPFGISRTPIHSELQLKQIIEDTKWWPATPQDARTIGKLIAAAGSLVHGIYNDVVTDFGWDTYGPYENQQKDNKRYTLLIRDFPDLHPDGLWPSNSMASVKQLQIFQIYQDVEWAIGFVGCHTIIKKGNPITGLRYYSLVVDGKQFAMDQINNLINELAKKAEGIYSEIRKKDFETLKQMVMLQECYQLKGLFEMAEKDWRPTAKMIDAIRDKPLQSGILPHGVMMTDIEEYKKAFHLNEFKKEVIET